MKKTIKLIFCLGSLMSLLNINATKNNDFLETTLLDNNEKISLIGKRNATSESLETSKMFTQVGLKDGDYYLRFATAIKVNDNLDNISTLNYTRIIEDNTKTAKAETVYYGISSGENTYYYDGTDLTTDASYRGQYLWTCYTIKFKNASVSNYLEKNIQMNLLINDKDEVTTTTTLLDNMNKFSFEAESDSVTYKNCVNVPEWGGISQNYKIGGQTGIKVENGNEGASFTFNIYSEYETYLMSSVYVTPFKEENYRLNDKYSLTVNNEIIDYKTSVIETGIDGTEYDGNWAKYFVKVDIGMLHLVQGNNTITFTSKGWAGLITDKIEFAGLANLKEFGYDCVIEAESESVTITQAENLKDNGITRGTYAETNTGYLKVENNNAGSSFTFNINSSTEGVAVLYTYVTPKKYEDYKLNQQSDLIINGTQITYESEAVLKDETLEDNHWATYFRRIKVARIELKEGNNTITFKTKGWHGLMMDKIVLTSTTSLSEISK